MQTKIYKTTNRSISIITVYNSNMHQLKYRLSRLYTVIVLKGQNINITKIHMGSAPILCHNKKRDRKYKQTDVIRLVLHLHSTVQMLQYNLYSKFKLSFYNH